MSPRSPLNVVPVTPSERNTLTEVAIEQRQNSVPANAATTTTSPAQATPAVQQANQVLQSGNRHVQTVPSAPAANPVSEIEVTVTANAPGGPTGPNLSTPAATPGGREDTGSTAIPNVATGPTPTGSSATTAPAVSQQAASETARSTTPSNGTSASATGTANAGGSSATSSQQLGTLRLSFEPNVHNEYDRVSYVFKLCMINDLDAEDPNLLNKFLTNQIRKIVIAESGVTTGFAIGDVVITDAISANFRNRSNMTTGLTIDIFEPYSLTLPDKMFQASQALGVRNWRLAPFLLQLEFRYIKSDGTFYTPSGNQKLIKVYQLLITDFDAQLTETGTKYSVQAGVKGNLGFRDAYQILPQTHRVEVRSNDTDKEFGVATGDNKVGTFFTTLGRDITNMYVGLRANNVTGLRLPLMIYKFIVEPSLANQEINFVPQANSRRNSFKPSTSNSGEVLVSRGISVSALVDDILASLKEPEFFLQQPDQGGLVKIPVIECVTRNVGWDLLTNDYVREFTFFIRLKDSNRPVPFPQYGQSIQDSPNLQQRRLQEVGKNLRKRYDYFYTGLNTEIISCDIKFNQMHIIPQPLLGVTPPPAYASASSVSPNDPALTGLNPASIGNAVAEQARLRSQALEASRQILQDANAGDNPDAAQIVIRAESEQRQAEETLIRISRDTVVPFETNTDVARILSPVTNRGAEAERIRERILRIQQANTALAAGREFLEDVNIPIRDNMLELSYHADPRDVVNSFARPTTIESGGGNDQPTGSRPMVTSILSQIYDRSGQHLLEVDLEIRGDPYWLGVTDLERTQELLGFMQTLRSGGTLPERLGVPTSGTSGLTSFSRDGLVDKHDQDANILLRFRAGAPPREDTGFQNLNEGSTFFYGVYTVIECMHEFKSGKFTQRLKAYRDVLINVEQLRAAERTAVNATQPRQVTPAVTVQATSSTAAPQAGATPQVSATNPNASPQNLQRSAQAQEQTRPQETPATPPVFVEIPNNNGPGIVRPTLRPGYREPTTDRRGRYILPPTGE